jgi:beta-galactosidase
MRNFTFLSLLSLFCLAAAPIPDGKIHKLTLQDVQFKIDDQPIRLVAGEMHLERILPEFWEDRIKKTRAMGLNTISIYLFWNQIEPSEGKFDFQGINDVRRFVKLCQDNHLWVIVRAGPYVCAETEFGGFPAWLLKHHDIRIRANDPQFLKYCGEYVQKLSGQIADLQVNHGGPILMTQFENELGRIDPYLNSLHDIFVKAGFDGQLFTCDHSGGVWNQLQGIPNVLRGYNNLILQPRYQQATAANAPGYPIYTPEVYTGWFSIWAGKVAKKTIADQLKETNFLLDHNMSFCYYVFNGGTNFGFTAGSNANSPIQTTYDYDSPVDELGRVAPKYHALRDLFIKRLNLTDLPEIPADPAVIEIPAFHVAPARALLDALPSPALSSKSVVTMEDIDQSTGFILYRKKFDSGIKGTLDLGKALDYSIVMLDGKTVGEAFTGYGPQSFQIPLDHTGPCTLDILVHNLGRTSSPFNQGTSRKGLNDNPTLNGTALTGWTIFSLPLDDPKIELDQSLKTPQTSPMFYTGNFTLDNVGETYLDMRNWHFGVVWVNGHNLGRYWDVGASRSLYLPSVWQKAGTNQITILELRQPPTNPEIKGMTTMMEEPAQKFTPMVYPTTAAQP